MDAGRSRHGRAHRGHAGCAALALLAAACTNTVVPPSDPEHPAAAFLLDHGRHASVVIEHDGRLTRYAYGHWAYYAENRTGAVRASGTLFGSNVAGLGRKRLASATDLADVRRAVRVPIEAAWRIDAPADRTAALAARLDRLFTEGVALENPLYDLTFVRHPAPYNLHHNSNHMAGEWLRALGCRVDMAGPYSIWRVKPPQGQ